MSLPSPNRSRRADDERRGDRLRIALTSPYCWPEVRRGGERYLHELAWALRTAGHDVHVVSTARRPSEEHVLDVAVRRLRRRRVPGIRGTVGEQIAFGAQVLRVLGTAAVDVWHALTPSDAAAAAATSQARREVRSVFTALGIPDEATVERRADRHLHRFVVDHVDAYIAISRTAGERLRADHGREPSVIPPGVDLAAYQPARRRHDRPALLFAGSNDVPRKNLPLLLDAVGQLRRRRRDVELWLVGPGDPGPALRSASPEARDAVTVAHVADQIELRERYGRAWATVLPSVDEAFGMTVIEGLASGTPAVVRADGGGPAEIVAGDRDAGVLAGPSAAELAEACADALDLAAVGAATVAACRGVAGRYDWRRSIVPRIESVYRGAT